MNTFDYWFDYIVRNGKYSDDGYWLIKIGRQKYSACHSAALKEKCIIVHYIDFKIGSQYNENNFCISDKRLRPLIKPLVFFRRFL